MKLRSKFTIWSGISLIFIAAIGIVAWFAIQQMLISADSIEHTHQMIQHSLQLKNNIYKMEANEKYFLLLTEESHFLQEYTDIKVKIEKEFSFLLEEVITPTQRDLLKTIKVKVNNWDKTVAVVEINSSKEKARKSSKLNAALILKKKQLDLRQSKSSTVNEEKLQETGNNPPLNPLHGGEQSLQFVSEKTGEIANNPPINPLPGGEQKGWAIPPSKEKEHLESTVILQTIADKPSIEHPPSPRLRRTGQASSIKNYKMI